MQQDVRTLKRKVDAITQNINIYRHDLKRHKSKLLEKYGIDGNTESKLEELKKQLEELEKNQQKILRRASRILERIDD